MLKFYCKKWKSIKMLLFDWKIRNWSEYWNLRTVSGIDQNVEICKMSSRSKCWNLSEKGRLIKMSKFERKGNDQSKMLNLSVNVGLDQILEIWVPNVKSIKMFEIWVKNGRLIKYWYFTAKVEIDQNVGVRLKNKEWIRT